MQLFVEHLTVIDFAYLHPDHGIEGESLICDVTLHGALDHQGMIMDFGPMKKKIKAAIDDLVDHKLVATTGDASLKVEQGDLLTLHYTMSNGDTLTHRSPNEAVFLLDAPAVTPAALTEYLEAELMNVVNETVERVEISLHLEATAGAYYHYAHGLKKHDGNCQRIAHGHRSKLIIFKDGVRDEALEAEWATRWKHIYIGTQEDVTAQDAHNISFAYTAPQGAFELIYPAARCHMIDTESTVENISQHLADALKSEHPEHSFSVRAYEGVKKGAVGLSGLKT